MRLVTEHAEMGTLNHVTARRTVYELPDDRSFRMPRISYNPNSLTLDNRWMSVEVGGYVRFGSTLPEVINS